MAPNFPIVSVVPDPLTTAPSMTKILQMIAAVLKLTILVPTAVPKTLAASLAPRDQPKNNPPNKNNKIVILDIPLLLENKINKKNDILVYVDSRKSDILIRLKKRKNFNQKLLKKFRTIQFPSSYKKKKSHFVIKNNFTKKSVKDGIKNILKEIL